MARLYNLFERSGNSPKAANTGDIQMKQMSKALQEVFDYRDRVNDGHTKIIADDYSSVVYLYENRLGQPCARGYKGRAKKPAFNFRYSNVDRRATAVAEWMKSMQGKTTNRRKREDRALNPGDVLVSTWGYDQTNVDYFMVTKLIGKSSVEIVEIGCISSQIKTPGGFVVPDEGLVVPDKSKVVGDPMRRVVDGVRVRINDFQSARKQEPKQIDGEEVYSPMHFTAYH